MSQREDPLFFVIQIQKRALQMWEDVMEGERDRCNIQVSQLGRTYQKPTEEITGAQDSVSPHAVVGPWDRCRLLSYILDFSRLILVSAVVHNSFLNMRCPSTKQRKKVKGWHLTGSMLILGWVTVLKPSDALQVLVALPVSCASHCCKQSSLQVLTSFSQVYSGSIVLRFVLHTFLPWSCCL